MQRFFIHDYALINALGDNKQSIADHWAKGISPGMTMTDEYFSANAFNLALVKQELSSLPKHLHDYDSRNNRLLMYAADQMHESLEMFFDKYKKNRIGVVLGTSTSGIDSTEIALKQFTETGVYPSGYHLNMHMIGSAAQFLQQYLRLSGPALTVSTACSSSGNAFAVAKRLLDQGFCDAVIVGGADSLCRMTVQGFSALNSIDSEQCQPFSQSRRGINIGEAAGLFILSQAPSDLELYGVGCSSDAHHISAPEPSGSGAMRAINEAIAQSPFKAGQVDYINLHGTATQLNDAMESQAVSAVFGEQTLCSSTKSLTGHTLGAAAATELGLCLLLLDDAVNLSVLPAHVYDGDYDPKIAAINMATKHNTQREIKLCMSNSFAFGGNNTSLMVGKSYETR